MSTKKSLARRIYWDVVLSTLTRISPEVNTSLFYFTRFHRFPDLKNPQSFNEKLCWLKLKKYKSDPLVKKCADKYTVREYVREKGLGDILPVLIASYDDPESVDWEALPQRFAMKLNVGSGANIICTDKSSADIQKMKRELAEDYKASARYYLNHSEMQYKDVERKILVEKFIETQDGHFPPDYKFFCFNGEPKCVLYISERDKGRIKRTYFDLSGNVLDFLPDTAEQTLPMTERFQQMIDICRTLSADFPFVRVDLYDCNERIIFGELTFTPAGATSLYTEEGSRTLGDWLDLSELMQ